MRLPIISTGVVALLLLGCETGEIRRVGDEPREAIAQAALAKYPGASEDTNAYRLAAVDDPSRRELTLLNLTDNAVPAATIWVNGAFVRNLTGIPPRGSVELRYSELLEAGSGTRDLRSIGQGVRKVELEIGDKLISVQGPSKK